jgi:hypothetical protein
LILDKLSEAEHREVSIDDGAGSEPVPGGDA